AREAASKRDALRDRILMAIRRESFPEVMLDVAVQELLRTRSDTRLDDAVDILKGAGKGALRLVRHAEQGVGAERSDDYWYVLYRALPFGLGLTGEVQPVLECGLMSNRSAVREAIIESLAEQNEPLALRLLKRIAEHDSSPRLRSL